MERLTILCFGGTYALALLAELARLIVRGAARWYLALGLTAVGWAVQTVYLVNLARADQRLPITTVFESLVALSWIFAAIALYLMARAAKPVAVGIFVLPVVLGLIVFAALLPQSRRIEWGGSTVFWGSVHGLFLLLGAVSTCVAFAAGLMYLAQSNRLKHKRPPRFGLALPSLEQSERVNRGAITIAFPLLTFGLLIGVALSLSRAGATIRWTDPKVMSGLAMWLVFAGLLHARYRPALRGRSVVWLTIVAFAFLVFAWVGVEVLGLPTAHGAPRTGSAGRGAP